ncbi:hypothetical protein CYMTET_43309 [Cymbomonas tetramitiformis]|uniref:Uncharacterized protein n=1 Tax=Cymbomonas tetramitiformis TaxID=36881 RepID=A0AAE0C3H4_9CHLO|nr:hypothetical protein CYMTET_43309 [Cymbomonas tetramitiformis]
MPGWLRRNPPVALLSCTSEYLRRLTHFRSMLLFFVLFLSIVQVRGRAYENARWTHAHSETTVSNSDIARLLEVFPTFNDVDGDGDECLTAIEYLMSKTIFEERIRKLSEQQLKEDVLASQTLESLPSSKEERPSAQLVHHAANTTASGPHTESRAERGGPEEPQRRTLEISAEPGRPGGSEAAGLGEGRSSVNTEHAAPRVVVSNEIPKASWMAQRPRPRQLQVDDDFCVQLMTNMTTFCRTSKILDCCHRNMEFAFLHGCWCSDAAVEKGGLELQAHKWFIENKECEDASAPTADDWMLEEYCLSWGEEPSAPGTTELLRRLTASRDDGAPPPSSTAPWDDGTPPLTNSSLGRRRSSAD